LSQKAAWPASTQVHSSPLTLAAKVPPTCHLTASDKSDKDESIENEGKEAAGAQNIIIDNKDTNVDYDMGKGSIDGKSDKEATTNQPPWGNLSPWGTWNKFRKPLRAVPYRESQWSNINMT
jgi:hypothetical protein